MGRANSPSYAAGVRRVNSGRGRAEIAALSHQMQFLSLEIAANALYSERARTAPLQCAGFSPGDPGGPRSAIVLGVPLSSRGRRFSPLRRHRQELASPRNLWGD